MKKKLVTILVIFSFLSAAAFSIFPSVSANIPNTTFFDMEPLRDVEHDSLIIDREFAPPNSPWHYPLIDDYYGGLYWIDFVNPFNGTFGNIWVGLDPEYDEYIDFGPVGYSPEDIWLFGYPWTPEGIPGYLPEGYRDAITGADLLEVLYEFDNNIHDTNVEYFGMYNNDPAERPGPYGDGTVQIMIFNVKDEFFYSPDTAPGFIEGYFWSAIAAWGANAFHMDSYQWWRRQGENPPMIDPYTGYDYSYLSPRIWEYEGTFAHEFQHLIHFDRDPDELSWVDEGCATLAEWLCGYGFSPGHISEYLLWFWDTSLVVWEQYLANYGAVFLFAYYMYEHYGGANILWDLVQDQANGIEGWENALAANGIKRSFDQIFQDWCIANYIDDTSFAHGRYGYYGLDLPSENTFSSYYGELSIPYVMELWDSWYHGSGYFDWFVNEYPYDGAYIGAGRGLPYTASYVEFTDTPFLFEVEFDGQDYAGTTAYSGEYEWGSGMAVWAWRSFYQTFSIPDTGATLNFMVYFEIEDDWDYGYVEVYDKTDDIWVTLEDPSFLMYVYDPINDVYNLVPMRDFVDYPQENPNCPDGREPTTYEAAGTWHAFTGLSDGWVPVSMDLTPFAGHDIELYFTTWQDGAYTLEMMFVDDISIPEIGFFDDMEAGEDGWSSTGWSWTDGKVLSDFEVSFITETTLFKKNGDPWKTFYYIDGMKLDDDTEVGKERMIVLNSKRISSHVVMVVANQPGYEHTYGVGYTYSAQNWKFGRRWWRCCH